jgi:predicted NAD/FAD-dependent oxidoreductase
VQIKGEPLDWIGCNQHKGISEVPGITVHAGPEWSREHFETGEAEITASLLSFAEERLGTDLAPKVVQTSITRWRYSWVTAAPPEVPSRGLGGSTPRLRRGHFRRAKVEGAVLSGLAAADRLLGGSEAER